MLLIFGEKKLIYKGAGRGAEDFQEKYTPVSSLITQYVKKQGQRVYL